MSRYPAAYARRVRRRSASVPLRPGRGAADAGPLARGFQSHWYAKFPAALSRPAATVTADPRSLGGVLSLPVNLPVPATRDSWPGAGSP